MNVECEVKCPLCGAQMAVDGMMLECDECGRSIPAPKLHVTIDEQRNFVLTKVFNGVLLKSPDNEEFGICMRDSGFEFSYGGKWYEAKGGVLKELGR